jgi:flagellar hook-length control protein FliK
MTLVLNPENLGPVEVSVTLTKGAVDLILRGAHDLGRAALLDGLPDLRRDLEASGLNPSRLEVDRDTGGSWLDRHAAQQQAGQHASGQRGQHQNRDGDRVRPWGAPADSAVSGPIPSSSRSTSSGVDVRV